MNDFHDIKQALLRYQDIHGAREFFHHLGYKTIHPLPLQLEKFSERAFEPIQSVNQIFHLEDDSMFRIFHVELCHTRIRRTDIRRFLETFYRRQPQGENLFIFSTSDYEELAFVTPRRILDPREKGKIRLWLRTLQVHRKEPYRTDLEVLNNIRIEGALDSQSLWEKLEEAFSVQKVTEKFYKEYAEIFLDLKEWLKTNHPDNSDEWARDYAHILLNRIMFFYFVIRKGWLSGPNGNPDRHFMRHFWEAYRDRGKPNTFHRDWLDILFFRALNAQWQNLNDFKKRFPEWLLNAFSKAPYLNGGLYTKRPGLDDRLTHPVPDSFFKLLFEKWEDGTYPGFFERYNFTVVETDRFNEEVAVDPEMLGIVYERLVNITYEKGEGDLRGEAGVFYTPRTEIDLMCRLALVDWLTNQFGDKFKNDFYQCIFAYTEEEKKEADEKIMNLGLWEELEKRLKEVRVCDPACGSGSFLIGMLLVLDDLQERCSQWTGNIETSYERRKRILRDQLYGVDVMEWAVRVAELRLWLQLVVETKLKPAELHFHPLLPNLDFKLRPGDSLLQTVGDVDLSLFRQSQFHLPSTLKGRLTKLKGLKRKYFSGEDPHLTENILKNEEYKLFWDILQWRHKKLQNEIAQKEKVLKKTRGPSALPGMHEKDQSEADREKLKSEIQSLKTTLSRIQTALQALKPNEPPPFVWDLAFVEIFENHKKGFDIIIGNPPYVRQEKIRDYLGRFTRDEYKERLNRSLEAIYPSFMKSVGKISKRSDYYVYFYLHSLSLLAEKGTFCFITSNSWLDVDFGKHLQEFFLRYGQLKMVIDNRARRSFAQADVNTVIVLAGPPNRKRPWKKEEMQFYPIHFIAFKVPFEEVLHPVIFWEIEGKKGYQPLATFHILKKKEYRSVRIDAWTLYNEALENDGSSSKKKYVGNKWGGKYLRAPDIFFTILEKGNRYKIFMYNDEPVIVEDITDEFM